MDVRYGKLLRNTTTVSNFLKEKSKILYQNFLIESFDITVLFLKIVRFPYNMYYSIKVDRVIFIKLSLCNTKYMNQLLHKKSIKVIVWTIFKKI